MATIEAGEKKIEISDGADCPEVIDACQKLGVVFGCEEGTCGVCQVKIEEGLENLSERTEEEIDAGLDESVRRMCTCKVLQGNVKLNLYLQDY